MKDPRFKSEPGNHYPVDPISKRGIELREIIHRLSLLLACDPQITDSPSGWVDVAESDLVADAQYEKMISLSIEFLNRACRAP